MRTLPNLDLQAFFDLGEDGWDDEVSLNFLKLSVLTQGGFIDKVAATPGAPVAGDVYVFDETHPTQANKVAVYDDATWKYFTPREGWLLYNRTDEYFEKFDGTEWAELATGGAGLPPGGTTGQALVKVSNADGDADWDDVAGGGSASDAVGIATARVTRVGGQAIPNDTNTVYLYTSAMFDGAGAFDAANSRLKVPAGFNRATVEFTNQGTSDDVGVFLVYIYHWKDGGVTKTTVSMASTENGFFSGLSSSTGALAVQANDYFTAEIKQQPARTLYSQMSITLWNDGGIAPSGPLSISLNPLPAFQNSWTNYGSGFQGIQAVKTGRSVLVTGLIQGGGDGTTAVTLPAGWRPSGRVGTAARMSAGAGQVSILANGDLQIDFVGAGGGTFTYLNLAYEVPEADAYNGGGISPEGTAFPSGPAIGQRFYRTDRKIEYTWDGVRWLSTQLLTMNFATISNLGGSVGAFLPVPYRGSQGLWLERFDASSFRSAAGEWDIVLDWRSVANASTILATLDGAGDPTTTWVARSAALNVVLDPLAFALTVTFSEISGASELNVGAVLHYRLIG